MTLTMIMLVVLPLVSMIPAHINQVHAEPVNVTHYDYR